MAALVQQNPDALAALVAPPAAPPVIPPAPAQPAPAAVFICTLFYPFQALPIHFISRAFFFPRGTLHFV